ncbi:MAG TPA: isocitrate/isopropylmalate family dehydrogenase, partial [Acidimicrobiales bacterium]|nr:isocitrate/isopropylmalate family dehydrogenase [Acidimicrobiales bacterium]
MSAHRVVLLPGDGIGPDVVKAACRVIDAAGVAIEWDVHEVGLPAFERGGEALPAAVVEAVAERGVALKGPVSTPQDGRFRSVNIELRQRLDLYVQVRRCRSFSERAIDVLVARETTEDLYAGMEEAFGEDRAVALKPVSAAATRRAARAAVAYARSVGRRRLTVVHKATAMPLTDGLFLRVAREEADGLEVDDLLVDVAAAELVKRPGEFDTIFTLNLYGDILADLLGAVVGSVGLVAGVNLGDGVAVFEPAHGTAPRHAGHDRANPTAAVLCGALLLRRLGEDEAATRIEAAVEEVLREGTHVTYDVARPGVAPVSTTAMADAVIAAITVLGGG